VTASPRPRVAIIVGSLRADSINLKIAKSLASIAGDRLDVEIVPIADLPLYSEDLDAAPPSEYVRFREAIAGKEGIIFCTPEYNRGLPGGLKNAIDVGSRPYGHSVWAQKPAAVISASPSAIGGFGANHQLRQLCVFLDMPMLQQPEAYLGGITGEKFGSDGVVEDDALRSFLGSIADKYVSWIGLTHRHPDN
jgi:chromate reductase